MRIEASAPSNIALIKYMGKSSVASNLPANASFSYALDHMRTFVRIEEAAGTDDDWAPLEGFEAMKLSETGRTKFLGHFAMLKERWGIGGQYLVKSANNFPSDCGLASSASSFAALTLGAWELAKHRGLAKDETVTSLSALSRLGSGSSCRSLFTPWALWKSEGAEPVELKLRLHHAVIVLESGKKEVSSSEAHRRIASSLLYEGRPARAEDRLQELLPALRDGYWESAYELCWNEFADMHALFETSRPVFGYLGGETWSALMRLRADWQRDGDGPLVTLDAGPNIHLLYRLDQRDLAERQLQGLNTIKSWK
jgi:diphosphomevalonate decarboxylase